MKLAFVASAAVLVACQGEQSGQTTSRSAVDVTSSSATSTVPGSSLDFGGEIVTNDASATGRIANARCDRALACAVVGPGKQYGALGNCVQDQSRKVQGDLKRCPNEIDVDKLNACIQSVAQQDCSQLDSPIETIDACKRANLC